MSESMVSVEHYNALKQERDDAAAKLWRLLDALEPAFQYVRCGIGSNYGGEYFEKKLEQINEPLEKAMNEARALSPLLHNARVLEEFAATVRARAEALPLGAANRSRGDSAYNWEIYFEQLLRAEATSLRLQAKEIGQKTKA